MKQSKNLMKIFEYALNQEKTGREFFQSSLKRMKLEAAKSAFKRLIHEEENHIELLNRILKGLRDGPKLEIGKVKKVPLPQAGYFDKESRSAFIRQCVEEPEAPDVTIFNMAWLMEKDIREYYEKMAEKTEGEASKALLMLAQWEKGHETFFKEFRDKLAEIYSKIY